MFVQVQVLVYIFFVKGRVPVGGGGQRDGRPGACCEKLLLQWMKGVGLFFYISFDFLQVSRTF